MLKFHVEPRENLGLAFCPERKKEREKEKIVEENRAMNGIKERWRQLIIIRPFEFHSSQGYYTHAECGARV